MSFSSFYSLLFGGTVILSGGIYLLGHFIAITALEINGFRYTVLGEKGNTWWQFQLNRRFAKLLLYVFLVQGGGLLYSLAAIFSLIEIQTFYQNILLTTVLGIIFGLLACYLIFRLGFFKLLISIDESSPLKQSWHLLKGQVMRLFMATLFAISGLIVASFFIAALLLGIAVGLLFFFGNQISTDLIVFPVSTLTWILSWAILTQVYAHMYTAIKKEKA